jgi:hypothetical protein
MLAIVESVITTGSFVLIVTAGTVGLVLIKVPEYVPPLVMMIGP